MNREDIIRMARETGFNVEQGSLLRVTGIDEDLERFAALAAYSAIKPWADQLDAERKRFSEYNEMVVGAMQDVRRDEREWVGLNHFDRTLLRTTHAPLKQIYHDKNNSVCVEVVSDWDVFFDAVEAKLKEKNG